MGTPCNSPAHIISNHKRPPDQILNLPAVPEVMVPLPDSSPLMPSPLTSSCSLQQCQVNDDLHPIIQIMREQELGKFMLNIAVAVTAAVLLSVGNGKSLEFFVAHFVPFGLMTGFMAIWTGILLRAISPRIANVVEQVGISLVLILLYALVASFLPNYFSWVLWICACLSLAPLVVSMLFLPH